MPFDLTARAKQVDERLKNSAAAALGPGLAVVAVGGYGRRRLFPYSDIDLLILHDDLPGSLLEDISKKLLYPLWDDHLQLGYSFRTVEECVRDARDDISLATALGAMRLVAGSHVLYTKLRQAVLNELFAADGDLLVERLAELTRARWEKYADNEYLVEPDIKSGRGGLRDIESIDWAARFLGQRGRASFANSLLTAGEIAALRRAELFLVKVRYCLQAVAGRPQDSLTLQHQREVAQVFFSGDEPDVARLMSMVNRHTRACFAVSRGFWARIEGGQSFEKGQDGLFADIPGALQVLHEERQEVWLTAGRFAEAVAGLPTVMPPGQADETRKALVRLLSEGREGLDRLDLAGRSGLLAKITPSWRSISHLVVPGAYHLHAVDTHSYVTVGYLAELLAGSQRQKEPLAGRIAGEITHKEELLLAGLFHDLGKGKPGGDHAKTGARLAHKAAKDLGLSDDSAAAVAYLVKYHLLLSQIAVSRDISDPAIIGSLARQSPSSEHLKMLYLLTLADSLATGPGMWSKWKSSLVAELFFKVLHWIEGDEAQSLVSTGSDAALAQLVEALSLRGPRRRAETYVGLMPARYFSRFAAREIGSHFEMFLALEPRLPGFRWSASQTQHASRLTLVSQGEPELFKTACGILALKGANILAAEVFSGGDGYGVSVFTVVNRFRGTLDDDFWAAVAGELESVRSGEMAIGYRLAAKTASYMPVARGTGVAKTENAASLLSTVVEVRAPDRLGLLYELVSVLEELKLEIHLAIASTQGEEALDVFYVRDARTHAKITSAGRLAELRKAVEFTAAR